jgi:hypothetical protein
LPLVRPVPEIAGCVLPTPGRPSSTTQSVSGTGLDLRLRRLPNFSPAITDTFRGPFRALVLVKMITPGTCYPATKQCEATPGLVRAEGWPLAESGEAM